MSTDMLHRDLDGEGKPALGIQGRIVSFDEKSAKALSADAIGKKASEYREASRADSQIPRWMGATLGEAKKNIPDLNQAGGRTIARAYANDLEHVGKVLDARKEGLYREFEAADGTRERGIVSREEPGKPKREGMWLSYDEENRVRQIATFKQGKPHGQVMNFAEAGHLESRAMYENGQLNGMAYTYNSKGQITHKAEHESGKQKWAKDVDPVQDEVEKASRQAQFRAMNSMKIGR